MFPVAIVLIGVSGGLAAYSLLTVLFSEERRVTRRLRELPAYERAHAAEAEPLLAPFAARVVRPVLGAVGNGLRHLTPAGYRTRLDEWTVHAGRPGGLDAERLLAIKALLTTASGGLVLLIGVLGGAGSSRTIASTLIVAVVCYFLPDLWLHSRMSARQGRIRRTLPDMLDMLTISVEAGLGFDAAVTKLVHTGAGPLTEEFAMMLHEVNAGLTRREALKNLATRTDVADLNAFVMSMVQADVFGISVASVLRSQSHEMRRKRRQYAEEIAQKAPAKMVFPLVLCILPATLIVLMGPAVLAIADALGM